MKKISLLIIVALISTACSAPEDIQEERRSRPQLASSPDFIAHELEVTEDFTLHYMEAGTPGKPVVVFIHGTPGSWHSLGRLMTNEQLKTAAHMFSIDRPGWGNSLLEGRRSVPDFAEQSALIEPLLFRLNERYSKPLILVGHSYGGSIAPYLAWRNPELVNGVLMAASAISPRYGKPRWYNWAASIWPISQLIDERLQIANDEIWGVKDALKEMEDWWSDTSIPMIYVQGDEDELVHPENYLFALEHFPENTGHVIQLQNQGHLLHVQQRPLLAQLTLTMIEALDNNLTLGELTSCEPVSQYC